MLFLLYMAAVSPFYVQVINNNEGVIGDRFLVGSYDYFLIFK